ncbi:MAG: ZIP family metal transporter [Lunatimonas sp.]|uniref:ZIP family metal transporter n=1 Tax=Lunatimonas sp. TaxID=2060141 RepID=UPI00263AF1A3|nr:ZIP family metal transporter [Lunatimonas sp.]MCC5935834.1 ZIP family metal transporter [Lunatimonas sp.]
MYLCKMIGGFELVAALISALAVGLVALVGLVYQFVSREFVTRYVPWVLALTAGILLGNVFFHLLPEASHESREPYGILFGFIAGLGVFWLLDRMLHRHHREKPEAGRSLGYLTLIGDGFHNFIDGLVIGTSYLIHFELGVATTLAILLHELPQELGESGTMVYSGFTPKKTVRLNLLVSLTAVLGVLVSFGVQRWLLISPAFLLAFTAGGFLYVALGRLMPELFRTSPLTRVRLSYVAVLCLGLAVVFGINRMQPHVHHQAPKEVHLHAVPFGFVQHP